jgi:dolichyl-phosphate-mannose-protein mannosyltransferase
MGLLSLGIHLLVNTLGGYGYFRDELYYLACSRHLAAGYVDHPPFSIYLLAVTRIVLGDSLFAIRLIPAMVSGLSVAVLCRLVHRLGGGPIAMVIASLAFISSGQILSFTTYYSMNSLDILFWLLIAYVLVLLDERATVRRWAVLGLVLGIGLLNKTSVIWLGAGVASALLFTHLRSQLRTRGPYLAATIALLVFSPYILWNVVHNYPHLEFMRNAAAGKYSGLTRSRFLVDQFVNVNPPIVFLALLGMSWYFFSSGGRRFRFLAVVFLTAFGILLLNPHSKAEYLAAAYPLLFAGGGMAVERLDQRWGRRAPLTVGAVVIASGLVVAPLALPVLAIETYIRYAGMLGVSPSTPEKLQLAELPQFFADMQGWEELAQDVSKAYLSIPEEERPTTVALVGNYGEAGALDLYARKYPLPRVLCTHNSYWFWGVGDTHITAFIRLGGNRDDYAKNYGSLTLAGVHTCRYCMPYENNLNIFVARQRRRPIEEVWGEAHSFH